MSKKRPKGKCHICGSHESLSYEHLPPESAFNEQPARIYDFLEWAARDEKGNLSGGKLQPRGWGAYTLCENCNKLTGSWYVPYLTKLCRAGLGILMQIKPDEEADKQSGIISLIKVEFFDVYPLRVIKQIITMLLSASEPEFGENNPELASFVLNKKQKGLPDNYTIYLSLFRGPLGRIIGLSPIFADGQIQFRSEIAYPPFSYLMTVNSEKHLLPAGDISHFADFGYEDRTSIFLDMVVGFGHTPLPGDFRSKADIDKENR